LISQNYFTFPFYLPRVYRQWKNWPQLLRNYLLRRNIAAEYLTRDGIRLVDGQGTLAGTIAVVFIRREYGTVHDFRTIVDIGANVGSFAVYAAQSNPSARVYCYEPERENFGSLTRNIGINDFEDRISAFRCAVGSECGDRELAVTESLSNSFHMAPAGANTQTVPCTTLRRILDHHEFDTLDLLKLNCEGAEYEILEECPRSDLDRISNIRLEYHNLDTAHKNGRSLCRYLRDRGYRIDRFTRYLNTSGFIWAARTLNGHKFLLTVLPVLWSPELVALACVADGTIAA
jgi:FkbM family methyltransferase